jgi:hypothetical protein
LIDLKMAEARVKAWKVADARAAIKGHVNPVVQGMAKDLAKVLDEIEADK